MEKQLKDIERRLIILEDMISQIYDHTITHKRVCPICNSDIRLYLPFMMKVPRKNAVCPVCKSLGRHRFIWMYLNKYTDLFYSGKKSLLHFAPEQSFYQSISKMNDIEYYPVDININRPGVIKEIDIQDIEYNDDSFDSIICNHVLEHVPDDNKAISELFRVLKPGGTAFISVPIKPNQEVTLEDPSYNTPELREKLYGQYDHLRYYGMDIMKHLDMFSVKRVAPADIFTESEIIYYGLLSEDALFICTKEDR